MPFCGFSGNVSHRLPPAFDDHLDHCLIVPEMNNKALLRESLAFGVTQSISFKQDSSDVRGFVFVRPVRCVLHSMRIWGPRAQSPFGERCSSRCLGPTNHERDYHPYAIQRLRILPLTRWNCVKSAVCFLLIQLVGTNVRLPKRHKMQPEVTFETSRSSAKSES